MSWLMLVFGTLTVAVCGLMSCCLYFVYRFARKNHIRRLIHASGIPLFGAIGLGGLTVLAMIGTSIAGEVRSHTPQLVFQDTFGQPPPRDVENIRAYSSIFGDSATVALRFQTNQSTFDRLRPKELKRLPFTEYATQTPLDGARPFDWRLPITAKTDQIWLLWNDDSINHSFASETTLMTYDNQTQTAQFYFVGID